MPTVTELKEEILKAIEKLPENSLQQILDHINEILKTESEKRNVDQFLERVFKEDDNLLKRLSD